MSSKSLLSAGIVAVLYPALAAHPAHAQDSGRGATVLEEIVVTAQKREERLLDVPIAISAFTNAALVDTGAAQLADFLESAPGVGIVDSQNGTQSIQIRGINSTYGNAPVGYYLDELPFSLVGNTQVPDVRTYDLERVEILRGPQGTLYGDGSIGGTIRILTREPDLGGFDAGVDATGSDTTDGGSNYALKGMLNAPLKEGVAALRLVASREEYDGWIDNTTSGVEDQNERDIDNYRGKLRWKPTERLDMVFSLWHTKSDIVGNANSLDDRTTPDPADASQVEYDLYSVTLRYSFDRVDLVSATSWMDYQADSLTYVAGLFPFIENTAQDVISEELRLTSTGDGAFRWTAGFFYREMKRDTFADLPDFLFTQDLRLESESYAVFGEVTWSVLNRKLDLTLGLRYFEDDRLYHEDIDPATLEIIQSVDPTFTGTVEETFDSLNPRFNVAYRLSDAWMVYGNVAKGFRTGQPQPALSLATAILLGVEIPTGIEPETLWSYELGTKGTFLGGRASLEATAYYNDWDKLQVPVVIVNPLRALVNGGTARSQGVELTLALQPIDGLSLQLSGGYTDAEFTEDVDGININDGDRIPGVPETTLSAAATYRWPLTASLEGFVDGRLQYTSERTDTVNFATPSDNTTSIDLRAGLEGTRWGAYLFADNVTDEDGAVDVYLFGPDGPATRMRPRTIGLNLRYNFR